MSSIFKGLNLLFQKPPRDFPSKQINKIEIENYGLGLLTEESGEISQLVGKSFRFGIDGMFYVIILTFLDNNSSASSVEST